MSRVLVLMYHQVDTPASSREQRFCTPPKAFLSQMRWLKSAGFAPVSLAQISAHIAHGTPLPERSVHVTFDDGFVGVLEHAWPVMQELSIPATLFAVSACIGKTNAWMHQRGFPARALLSKEQVRLLADQGMDIGSHTRNHVHLPDIPVQRASEEILVSKGELEDLLGREVTHFAYPYGQVNAEVRNLVAKAGYHGACSTRSGFNRPGGDPYLIRRIDVFGTDKLWQFRQNLHFGTNEATRLQPLIYYAGRVSERLGLS